MVLETRSSVIQTKNAQTQYITIPSTMVSDSQYPFKGVSKVKVVIDPDTGIMIIGKDDIGIVPRGEIIVKSTQDGFTVKSEIKNLKCFFYEIR